MLRGPACASRRSRATRSSTTSPSRSAPGEVLALVGESGCGKTRTALALLGHARRGRAHRGRQRRCWVTVEVLRTRRGEAPRASAGGQIAYVPQDPAGALDPRAADRRADRRGDDVARRRRRARALARVSELCESVGLPGDTRVPAPLSVRAQRRPAAARRDRDGAVACDPLVVVLDEPTTGLDVTTQARVLELLRALAAVARARRSSTSRTTSRSSTSSPTAWP